MSSLYMTHISCTCSSGWCPSLAHTQQKDSCYSILYILGFFSGCFCLFVLIFLYQLCSNNKVQMMLFHCFFFRNQHHYFISLYMLLSYAFHYDVIISLMSLLWLFVLVNIIINDFLSNHFWTSKEMTIIAFLNLLLVLALIFIFIIVLWFLFLSTSSLLQLIFFLWQLW